MTSFRKLKRLLKVRPNKKITGHALEEVSNGKWSTSNDDMEGQMDFYCAGNVAAKIDQASMKEKWKERFIILSRNSINIFASARSKECLMGEQRWAVSVKDLRDIQKLLVPHKGTILKFTIDFEDKIYTFNFFSKFNVVMETLHNLILQYGNKNIENAVTRRFTKKNKREFIVQKEWGVKIERRRYDSASSIEIEETPGELKSQISLYKETVKQYRIDTANKRILLNSCERSIDKLLSNLNKMFLKRSLIPIAMFTIMVFEISLSLWTFLSFYEYVFLRFGFIVGGICVLYKVCYPLFNIYIRDPIVDVKNAITTMKTSKSKFIAPRISKPLISIVKKQEEEIEQSSEKRFKAGSSLEDTLATPIDASNFKMRVGPNYKVNKNKRMVETPAIYNIIHMDVLRDTKRIDDVVSLVEPLPITTAEVIRHKEAQIPKYFILNLQTFTDAPSILKSSSNSVSIVQYYKIDSMMLEKYLKGDLTNCMTLFKKFVANLETDPDMQRRFKGISYIDNFDSFKLLRRMKYFNGKPFLLYDSVSLRKVDREDYRYILVEVDLKKFRFLARKLMHQFFPLLPKLCIHAAITIQGETDDELPEGVVLSTRVEGLDLDKHPKDLKLMIE